MYVCLTRANSKAIRVLPIELTSGSRHSEDGVRILTIPTMGRRTNLSQVVRRIWNSWNPCGVRMKTLTLLEKRVA